FLPAPRLVVIQKSEDEKESGIGVFSKRGDHFVGVLVKDSAEERCGLRTGDRLFAVNGVLTEQLNNAGVMKLLLTGGKKIEVLILEENAANLYKELGVHDSLDLPNIVRGADATAGEAPSAFPLVKCSPTSWYGFYVNSDSEPSVHSVVPGEDEHRRG
ncbi:hypothetical protein PFISCL1PPCAC_8684, partial [Pristionchus fissidentatus]